jgi:myo-inositol-1(or 4)-monophosphatase
MSKLSMQIQTDTSLMAEVEAAVRKAAKPLADAFSREARPQDMAHLLAMLDANDELVLEQLRPALQTLRPEAGWIEDEDEGGALPPGEWWLVDPVEGNVNHIHGLTEWGISVVLVRDAEPCLAVMHLPLANDTYTAISGKGAQLNGVPISVSVKKSLSAALVATGQARPNEDADTYRRIGGAVTAMLGAALLVRVSVPSTTLLAEVAAGRLDLFWQHSQVRAGLLAGALLVREAGGVVSDLSGQPWTVESHDFVAGSRALQQSALSVLAPFSGPAGKVS